MLQYRFLGSWGLDEGLITRVLLSWFSTQWCRYRMLLWEDLICFCMSGAFLLTFMEGHVFAQLPWWKCWIMSIWLIDMEEGQLSTNSWNEYAPFWSWGYFVLLKRETHYLFVLQRSLEQSEHVLPNCDIWVTRPPMSETGRHLLLKKSPRSVLRAMGPRNSQGTYGFFGKWAHLSRKVM